MSKMEANNKGLPDDWEGELKKEEVKEGKRKKQSEMRAKVEEQDRDNIRHQKLERELKEGTAKKNKDGSYSKVEEDELDGDEPVTKEDRKRFAKNKKKKEPSTLQNIGRNVGNYVAKNSGMPSWLGRGGGMPPAMRMGGGAMPPALRTGVGKLPPAYSMGMGGEPPAWLFGGMPGAPAPAKGKKQKGNGLPSWFRY